MGVRLTRTGGPDVLKVEPITEARPGPGEAWIEQEAIGVNYLDVTQRNGTVPIPLPRGLGLEAAGCDAVLVWGACDLPAEVAKLTDGQKARVVAGVIKPATWNVFSLSDAAAAHAALEGGQSVGAILLKP